MVKMSDIQAVIEQMQEKLNTMEIKLNGCVNLFNSMSAYIQSFKSCAECGAVLLDKYVNYGELLLCLRCSNEVCTKYPRKDMKRLAPFLLPTS